MGKKKNRDESIIENILHIYQIFEKEAYHDEAMDLVEANEAKMYRMVKHMPHKGEIGVDLPQASFNLTAYFS